jgi:hypothetical protein
MTKRFNRLRPGDRVIVTNKEFPTWIPTSATVTRLGIRFPASKPPIRRETIQVRLDHHPFPEQLGPEPIRYLTFFVEDMNYELETEGGDA